MQVITKDILTVDKGVICHQVNCQRKMGSGLAAQIREKWPHVFEEYKAFKKNAKDFELLGEYQLVEISHDLVVCNIFGQLDYGPWDERYTDYGAINTALKTLWGNTPMTHNLIPLNQIYFPYKFGCDRGGGDWNIVSNMIEHYFPTAIICKL